MSRTLNNFNSEGLQSLISVSQFKSPATTWIKGADVLDVYSGQIKSLNVVLYKERIAYVGQKEPLINNFTEIIDASNLVLVPGYIEPHAHSFQVYNPHSLSEFALLQGTTTMLHDNLAFFTHLPENKMVELFDLTKKWAIKTFWWARLDPQIREPEMEKKFTKEKFTSLLNHPSVLQGGELTFWKDILDGDLLMTSKMKEARNAGKRVETHNPGASIETLNAVAAAGATSCHESINAEEIIRRIGLGYYTPIRYSSIRPDLPNIIQDLVSMDWKFWDRMMLTTDGSAPFFYSRGFINGCIRSAIESGLDPVLAYRMASLNPAVYYGLDQDLGGISPGRLGDIVFLEDLRNPTPVKVMANGSIVAENGNLNQTLPHIPWDKLEFYSHKLMKPIVEANWFTVFSQNEETPVIEMLNSVITLKKKMTFPSLNGMVNLQNHDNLMYVSLLHKGGEWVSTGIIKGFGQFGALASSYTLSGDIIILGKDPNQMAIAANCILEDGGGICLFDKNNLLYNLPLPLLGFMSSLSMEELIKKTGELYSLLQRFGYTYEDPIYSLLFLSATHLPNVRLTSKGVLDVKRNIILIPSRPL
ncbi:adenine deaminase C-terminal domain-containing protein [Alteribacillus sp. YIM 98480]|uniref:adenine deaminase C-terminal domain-containing protein n=1 Tax=Alteribacillus sp. YIM 98480 TaxID=2606599 RepID=UPI00131ACD5D|nr:adenine deaminase C-terminal domain-containing protein [Alteribacillus sp. YIM 98480]